MRYSIAEQYMFRCITLAKLGQYHASPNPMVGAVLVHNGTIIGEGWHQKAGQAHAEVNCINSVKPEHQHLISESTIYVSLEPCAHFGKTPPCANLIIAHQIPKVVIGCVDTFSEVSGKGIAMLEAAGIEVITGILAEECKALNKHFFTYHEQKRPHITLKWAESHDGFIAPLAGKKVMLSNHYALTKVHQMRANHNAFLVGYQTARLDNPLLSNRLWPVNQQPISIVLDPNHELPNDLHVFEKNRRTVIFTKNYHNTIADLQWINIGDDFDLKKIISHLYDLGIQSLVVEGGSKTLQQFIDQQLWDEALIFRTNNTIGNGIKAPSIHYTNYQETTLADNTLIHIFA